MPELLVQQEPEWEIRVGHANDIFLNPATKVKQSRVSIWKREKAFFPRSGLRTMGFGVG